MIYRLRDLKITLYYKLSLLRYHNWLLSSSLRKTCRSIERVDRGIVLCPRPLNLRGYQHSFLKWFRQTTTIISIVRQLQCLIAIHSLALTFKYCFPVGFLLILLAARNEQRMSTFSAVLKVLELRTAALLFVSMQNHNILREQLLLVLKHFEIIL